MTVALSETGVHVTESGADTVTTIARRIVFAYAHCSTRSVAADALTVYAALLHDSATEDDAEAVAAILATDLGTAYDLADSVLVSEQVTPRQRAGIIRLAASLLLVDHYRDDADPAHLVDVVSTACHLR